MKSRTQFTMGAIAGITTLAVAFPLVAQVVSAEGQRGMWQAAEGKQGFFSVEAVEFTAPSQECVGAMADLEALHLENFDETSAKQKARMAERVENLRAAALIADDTERTEAMKAGHDKPEDFLEEMPEELTAAMEAMQSACGGKGPGKKGFFMKRMHGGGFPGMMHAKPMMIRFHGEATEQE